MKRRSFLRGVAASLGATTLPLPVISRPAIASAPAGVPTAFHYGWACVYAQRNEGISPADIAEKFRIPLSEANGLFDRMLTRGVLQPPGPNGRSVASRPWQPWDERMAPQSSTKNARERDQEENTSNVAAAFRKMIGHVTGDENFRWHVVPSAAAHV